MKTLLIIGGNGFFGKSILDYSSKKKLNKWNIDKLIFLSRTKIKKNFLPKKNPKTEILSISADIKSTKKLPKSDYIIYAANSKSMKLNIKGINNFKKLILKEPKNVKILFTSSGAVYGNTKPGIKIKENFSINSKNLNSLKGYKKSYSKAKIFMEKIFFLLGKKKYNVSIARCFTFVGRHILTKNYAISNFINEAKKNKKIVIKSKANVYRSFMYSDDLVEWLLTILDNSNSKCPTYNVGSDEYFSLGQAASIVAKLFKAKVVSSISKNKEESYLPSIEKAKKKLGLKIKVSFRKAILLSVKNNDKNYR